MKISSLICLTCLILILSCGRNNDNPVPLSLHPGNPHYLMFRNNPVILIGSTEHYGAVMNLDFDYVTYLDELASSGLNVTRTFSGIYVEPEGAFGIVRNTMAPKPEKYICPWPRSTEAGYANGGNKFDLSKWDGEYFTRLKDFITQAGKRNIVVELDLFSNFYDTVQWKLSPLHAGNNINNVEKIADQKEILSLRHPEILDIQEKMVRKIVSELKDFDNLYYETCNEPYFGDTIALREWEQHMTGVIADAEKDFEYKHLISNNVANFSRLVAEPRDGVSIYNFHYAKPPVTVGLNDHLNKVIGDNETGFNGIHDATYRTEAWDFILAGGGLFNHLDYSFTTDNEDGTFKILPDEPGGGGKTLRNQFKILADFVHSLDFIKMKALEKGIFTLPEEENAGIHGLQGSGVYAVYIHRRDTGYYTSSLKAGLPEGSYTLTWIDTKSGIETSTDIKDHKGNAVTLVSPGYSEDIALKAVRKQ